MRKDLTNFWLAWRKTCDVRKCMVADIVRKTCADSPKLAADADSIAEDAIRVVKKTNKAMAGWISSARKVEALKWASGNVSAETANDADEGEVGSEAEEAENDAGELVGNSDFSQAEESDDDAVAKAAVVKEGQKYAKANRVSEFIEYVEPWRRDDLSVVSAFELIQTNLYATAQKGESDADGRGEPLMNGKKLKSYLFEDIGGRAGGLSQNLWGYLLKKQMVYVGGRPYPSRLIMLAKESFKNSVVESIAPGGDSVPAVSSVEVENLKIEIDEAADVFRKHLDKSWGRYSVKARVALCCAFMEYNMCDAFVERISGTSGKRLSAVKNRCVGEAFMALKDGGCSVDTVRGLFMGKGQSVLMEYADKDDACCQLVEHFGPRKVDAGN